METLFWLSIFIVFYTFFGYGILLYILVKLRVAIKGRRALPNPTETELPTLTLVVSAYNEAACMDEKIGNTLGLAYPKNKITYIFVTDGSTDNTPEIISRYPAIKLMHRPERRGKIAAMERAMETVTSEIAVFTDANTMLNNMALINIARHYADSTVGAVSGEKRVHIDELADATAGEGFYWKYESKLKTWDSELYSVVGAAGELFSVRTSLYTPVPPDTVLDDFMISMRIAEMGYRIVYEPASYATESSSENVGEELKRKVRIAAGGIQSILRLKSLFNPFRNFVLSFQYISHRVLRWTVTPFFMILAFIANAVIVLHGGSSIYKVIFACQVAFYFCAAVGFLLEQSKLRVKALFVPYYFCMMNYAVIAGIRRYMLKKQTVIWEKAKRK